MKNIKFNSNNYYLKIVLFLMIIFAIFTHNSQVVFSNVLNKNINNLSTPENELAIKYCDAINKKIFNGLNTEASLKYEYYFSSLKIPSSTEHEEFLKDFKLNVIKNCSYNLNSVEKKEFKTFIKKFLKGKSIK
tara:strand:- start:57 stop:455 length:399 start_codon:yes stop_codon:yes gene_type:complete